MINTQNFAKDRPTEDFRLSETMTIAWMGIVIILLIYYAFYFQPIIYIKLVTEDYWGEWVTFISYFFASFIFGWLFIKSKPKIRGIWFLLLAIGSFFISMEEISWGQRLLALTPPQFFAEKNFQAEISFHNIEGFWTNEWRNMKIVGIFFFLYGFLLPIFVSFSTHLKKFCSKIALPVPTIGISPFFLGVFVFFIFQPLLEFQEIGELLMGLAIFMLACQNWLIYYSGRRLEIFDRMLNSKITLLFLPLVGVLILVAGVVISPSFVAATLSSDGTLQAHTTKIIRGFQYFLIALGLLSLVISTFLLLCKLNIIKKHHRRKISDHLSSNKGLSMLVFLLIIILIGYGLMNSFGFEPGFESQLKNFATREYYGKGLYAQAEKVFVYIENKIVPFDKEILIYRGRNLIALNRKQEGISMLEEALVREQRKRECQPHSLGPLLRIARIYSYLGNKERAEQVYHQAVELEYSKLDSISNPIEQRSGRMLLGDIYFEMGRYSDAVVEFEKARDLSTNDMDRREANIRILHSIKKRDNK